MNKLDNIVNECNNAYHRIIKMKPVDVKDNTFIDSIESHSNDKYPKFKVSDLVKIFFFFYIYNYGSKQTYNKLNIYNHQTPKYSKGIWEWKKKLIKQNIF